MDQPCVLDACVLIDFCQEDSTLLMLAGRCLGPIVVLSPILEEVHELDASECARLNLEVVEPEVELLLEAIIPRGGLSLRDRLCLGFARRHSCRLYTNDKPLLNAALADGIDARWGLEILVELVALGELSSS